jgi:hypothetical protein
MSVTKNIKHEGYKETQRKTLFVFHLRVLCV